MVKGYQQNGRAGLELLRKRLLKLAEAANQIGHSVGGTRFTADADAVQAVLDAGPLPEPPAAQGGQRLMLRTGFSLLAHNLRAASGTVGALGREDLAAEFTATAEEIEQHVLPHLEEQTSLSLVSASAGS